MQQDQSEFSKAFNGEEAPMTPAPADQGVTEDNKNISDAPAESAPEGSTEAPAAAVVIDIPEAASEFDTAAPAEEAVAAEAAAEGEPVAEEQAEMASPEGDVDDGEEAMSPEDIQRQKSWEGRLKKREEELAAREAELGSQPAAEEVGDEEINAIKAKLAEDFGDDFVNMIAKIASHSAKSAPAAVDHGEIGTVKQVINQAIQDVQEAFQAMHFGQIADAHDDFQEIFQSEQFNQWVGTLPEEQQQAAMEVVQGGRAGQVVKLLNKYKDSLQQESQMSEDEDAAMGVSSSSPVSLPTRAPASSNDEYKQAWDAM